MHVTALSVYPVKSCGGIALETARVGRMGIRYDRQWMFVDEHGMFVAQRSDGGRGIGVRTLCLVRTALVGDTVLRLTAPEMPPLDLPIEGPDGPPVQVRIWDTPTTGVDQGAEAAAWAGELLSRERPGRYRLVRMADETTRVAKKGEATLAYADGYPFLVISDASLEDLNGRLTEALPMNRFRPNIVIGGCDAYTEDRLDRIRIGDVELEGTTLCVRCPIPTTNQETAERGKEPLRTLATYRRTPEGVIFGRNFNHSGTGQVRVGDPVVEVSD